MERIEHHERVTGVYGAWPSFHDAEVRSVHLGPGEGEGLDSPVLTAVVYVFRMTPKVDPHGFLVLEDKRLVTLRFLGVRQLRIEGLSGQNPLMGLRIEDISDRQLEHVRFEVRFAGSMDGLDAQFTCRRVIVDAVEPVPTED